MRTAALALAAVLLAGCGAVKSGRDKSKAENAVKAFSIDYVAFFDSNQRPPNSADELGAFVQGLGGSAAMRPGELGEITAQWGARLDPAAPGAGGKVLAWGRSVGGDVSVLMQDGSVRWMTEAALASAPKAEPAKRP